MKLHEYNEMMSYVLRRPMSMGGFISRQNLYDGGVVELAKNLSNEGKSLNEILEAIQKQFPDLPEGKAGGRGAKRGTEGKPADASGVRNILKKELSPEVYAQRHGPKRFTQETINKYLELRDTKNKAQIQKELDISPAKQGQIDKEYGLGRRKTIVTDKKFSSEDIEKFKELRKTMSSPEITEELGMSESYQSKLAKDLKLPKKQLIISKKIAEAESVVPTVRKLIDPTKSPTENLKQIYPKIKDQTFKKGTTKFGKPTEDRVRRAINNALMDANQLSVEEYKDEIRKMVANRNYAPKGLDPLGMKTDELKNYPIPNYKQAKAELADEIPSLDRRIQTNINIRKTLKRKQKEIADPNLKLSRLSQRARRKQIGRLEKLGLTTTLSPREEAINQTQTSIQKSSNDRIKANPETMKKFLKDNPEILKALGTRVNRKTGEIFYENPNLGFLNKNPKDTQRFFELDHGREISKQAGRLTDVPENRNTIPGVLNRGFKRDAEIYIESNPNPKDPKVQAVLEEAKKLKVRIRPKVPTGTFKADDFFRPVANPLTKISDNISFYAPDEFQTKEVVLPRDKTGKVVLGLSAKKPGGPTLGANLMPADQVKRLVDFRKIPEDIKNISEEMGKPLKEKSKIFGKKAAQQIAQFGGAAVLPMLGAPLTGFEASRIAREEGKPTTEAIADVFLLGGVIRERRIANAMGSEAYEEFAKQKYERDIVGRIGSPRGEGIVNPELLELRKIAEQQVSLEDQARQDAFLERQSEQGFFPEIDRTGAMYGGRVGFAEGPKDPKRRKFIKIMGGLASLPLVGKYFKLAEPLSKAAPVATESVKLGFDKFMVLVNKIKSLGDDVTPQRSTIEREKVTVYQGKDGSEYELIEDLNTGNKRVTKDKPGMATSGDKSYDTIDNRTVMEYTKGETIPGKKKGTKVADQYDEYEEVAGVDGTFDDVDDVRETVVKEIEDELK